jgi:predicted nucleotidyltransferase
LQKLSTLKQICKKFLKQKQELMDIVIFGSVARKKTKPNDVDVALIFRNKIDKELKQKLAKKIKNSHITELTLKNISKQTLWKTLLHEGISIKYNKKTSTMFGFKTKILIWYSLGKLNKSKKVQFSYALKGRDGKSGLLKKYNGIYLGKGSIMIPIEADDEFREFFINWKTPFNRRRILIEE